MSNPTVHVVNLGCRVNRVESDRMTVELDRRGFDLVDEDDAEIVVINTCAVTGEAEAKTRKAVRHALGCARDPWVIVTGCAVNLHADVLTALSERVIAEPSKGKVAACAERLVADRLRDRPHSDDCDATALTDLLGRSRIGVKVQDGCDNRCSYCIVWKARGPERSVALDRVLDDVRAAAASGIAEVVLTGVNLGAYRASDGSGKVLGIDGLLESIVRDTDIPHIRLSSIEPMDIDGALLARMAAHPTRFAPFLHVPIQSGCTETLARMNRPYDADDLLDLVDMIRGAVPGIALSGDLIVGFPGETDEEFECTRALVERIGFSRLHLFRYSARPGTPAATMPDQVPAQTMAARSAVIRALVDKTSRADAAARIGTIERAVIEYPGRGTLGSFHRVIVDDSSDDLVGRLVDVAIMDVDSHGVLRGRVVRSAGAGAEAPVDLR